MNTLFRTGLIAATALIALPFAAQAANAQSAAAQDAPSAAKKSASPVALKGDVMAISEVTDPATGEKRIELVEAKEFTPGTKLSFGTTYSNNGAEPATNVVAVNPLPAPVRLSGDADPMLDVSVDGGKTWGPLSSHTITDPQGATRPARHADVTHVRWVIDTIEPGATGRLAYPAIIR